MSVRHLQILAGITIISVLAAIGVVITDQNAVNARFTPRLAFPSIEDRRSDISDISITGEDQTIHLQRNGSGPWGVASSDGYPADPAAVVRLISAMENLMLVDPRTKKPENFSKLKLDDPSLGNGAVGIEFHDREDALISGLILGARQSAPTADQPGQFYIRLAEGTRAWLAEGRLITTPIARNWLDQAMGLPLDTDIKSIKITPSEGRSYEMAREMAGASFKFKKLPKERRLRSDSAPLQLAQSLAFLTIDDARSRPERLPKPQAKISYEMFDGRSLKLMQWTEDTHVWLAVDLKGEWAEPLTSRTANYIFRIAPARAKTLSPTLESLLIPKT